MTGIVHEQVFSCITDTLIFTSSLLLSFSSPMVFRGSTVFIIGVHCLWSAKGMLCPVFLLSSLRPGPDSGFQKGF